MISNEMWDDYDPYNSRYSSVINFPNNVWLYKNQFRNLTYLQTGFLFMQYASNERLDTITLELKEDIRISRLLYEILIPHSKLELPIAPTRYSHLFSSIISPCPICRQAGVLDWVGAIRNKFAGYCHEGKSSFRDSFLESSRGYHYQDVTSYTIYPLELTMEIKKNEDRGIPDLHLDTLGFTQNSLLKLFGKQLSSLEKYVYNYLSYEERLKYQSYFDLHIEEFHRAIKEIPKDNNFKTISGVIIIKQINKELIDDDLYKVCTKCNGDGFIALPEIIQEDMCFRIRNRVLGHIDCPNIDMLETIMDMFASCKSSRHLIQQLKGIINYDYYSRELYGVRLRSNE